MNLYYHVNLFLDNTVLSVSALSWFFIFMEWIFISILFIKNRDIFIRFTQCKEKMIKIFKLNFFFTIIFWYSFSFCLFSGDLFWYLFLTYALFFYLFPCYTILYIYFLLVLTIFLCYFLGILLLDLIVFLYLFDNK